MTTRRKSIATSECTFHDFMFITPLALPMSKDRCHCLCVTCSSPCSTFLQRKKENLVGQHPRKDTCMGCRCARARTAGISRHSETGYLHWQLTFSSTPLPSVKANLCIVHSTCARTLHTYRPVCCRELGFRTSQEYLAGPAGHPCFFYSCCWLTVSMLTELS